MSTPTDVDVQLSPEGDPLGIVWQRPDYRAGELTGLTTKLLERVADDVATRVRDEMRRVLADSAAYGHHPRETARALQEAYGEVLSSTLSRMLTIARTEQLDAYRAGQRAAELANAQVITGWEWHSVLPSWLMHRSSQAGSGIACWARARAARVSACTARCTLLRRAGLMTILTGGATACRVPRAGVS